MFLLIIFIINSTFTTFKKIKSKEFLKGRTHGSLGEYRMSIYDAELLLLICSNLKHNFTALGNNLYSLLYFYILNTHRCTYITHTRTQELTKEQYIK